MNNLQWISIGLLIAATSCSSCNQNNQTQGADREIKNSELIEMNRQKVKIENDQIDAYIERRGWDVIESGTGLRYYVYNRSDSAEPFLKVSQRVLCDYEVFLIDGTKVYDTKEKGTQMITVGKDHHEAGLHEGLTHIKNGESAWFVIPSYLAHGNTGDREKIPGDATVIYHLHVKGVQ